MDYRRIDAPLVLGGGGGGGFSPKKLRSMLLGVEKKRKEEEELDSRFNLRSQGCEVDEMGGISSDSCKDVDVVSVLPDCSTSTRADSSAHEMAAGHGFKDHPTVNSRMRSRDDLFPDYDSGHDTMSACSSIFEFQKAERAHQRVSVAPFSKPAPSKWDDAQKWIASPTSNRPKAGQGQVHGGQGVGSRKGGIGYFRQPSKVVVELPDPKVAASEEPDTKRIDTNHSKKENGGHKFVSWDTDPYPSAASYGKHVAMIENSLGESAIILSKQDSNVAIHSATTTFIPPSTARSVSMRDMGTEMTPIASQEPSRNGTPVRATTPLRSPNSSRHSTPGRDTRASAATDLPNDHPNSNELSERELQMKTRREIIALGTQLGKMNIAAWASKEEGDKDSSASLKNVAVEQPKSATEMRASAWEEAEKAKCIARYKHEEMQIQAWENHQKAKAEADMKKTERLKGRGRAHDKLMSKLAATRIKADKKLAAAEANRNRQAAKTDKQTEQIRRIGRITSSFWCCRCCS